MLQTAGDGINKEDTAMQKAGASLVAADTASSGSVAGYANARFSRYILIHQAMMQCCSCA